MGQAEGRGTGGVGVKSVETVRNTSGEGGDLGLLLSQESVPTLMRESVGSERN